MSQDHLEMFFGSIRSSLGLNNNPSVHQFKTAYRKLVVGAIHYNINENCLNQDDTQILLPVNTVKTAQFVSNKFDLADSSNDIYLSAIERNSEYKSSALNYIAGFIQKKVQEKEMCIHCSSFLRNYRVVRGGLFLNHVNRGGLTKPSEPVEKIVQLSDSVFSTIVQQQGSPYLIPNLVKQVSNKVVQMVNSKSPDIFQSLDDHVETLGSHRSKLIEKICACYISLRSNHYCSEQNKKTPKIRVASSKLILFKNQ